MWIVYLVIVGLGALGSGVPLAGRTFARRGWTDTCTVIVFAGLLLVPALCGHFDIAIPITPVYAPPLNYHLWWVVVVMMLGADFLGRLVTRRLAVLPAAA